MWDCHASNNQQWRQDADGRLHADSAGAGKCMTLMADNSIKMQACTSNKNQIWNFVHSTNPPTPGPTTSAPTTAPTAPPTTAPPTTGAPTGAPTTVASTKTAHGSSHGDPHVQLFGGEKFDVSADCSQERVIMLALGNVLIPNGNCSLTLRFSPSYLCSSMVAAILSSSSTRTLPMAWACPSISGPRSRPGGPTSRQPWSKLATTPSR